jgi:ADP-ribosylglycohydrolase
MTITTEQRALGALWGTACGDAFGMPNSFLQELPWLTTMQPGPAHSRYHAGYVAGRYTDDTEQALALTEALCEGFTRENVAGKLLEWFVAVGGKDSLAVGPSTMRAMLDYQAGTPVAQLGKSGVTNGSAMRISPVGVFAAFRGMNLNELLDTVETACAPTHDTSPAISGSAAVAAAVMTATNGADVASVIQAAAHAARAGAQRGRWIYCPDIGDKIEWACDLVTNVRSELEAADVISRLVGTGEPCTESVPAALAFFAYAKGDPEIAIRVAANSRGDTDTTAAMAGAIAGAFSGADAIPATWKSTVAEANHFDAMNWYGRLKASASR